MQPAQIPPNLQPLPPCPNLILQTDGGGGPFLNDTFTSYLNMPNKNLLFGELINYLDGFEEYSKEHQNPSTSLLSSFFNLDSIYLGFTEYIDDFGTSDETSYFVQSNTGKAKITQDEYLKYVGLFQPSYSVIPFEYISPTCGKKRLLRCYKKLNKILTVASQEIYHNIKFLIPLYLTHGQYINLSELRGYKAYGMLIFTDYHYNINYETIQKYKTTIQEMNTPFLVKANSNSIFDGFIGHEIGCTHFEGSLPFVLSKQGKSLFVDFKDFDPKTNYGDIKSINKFDFELKTLDLNNHGGFENDGDGLINGCGCFVCGTGYDRAYIHHGCKCKEGNGNILLSIHNVYQCRELYGRYKDMTNAEERMNFLMWFIKNSMIKSSK